MPRTIKIHGVDVPLTTEPSIMKPQMEALMASGLLERWAADIDPRFCVRTIRLQSIDLFGKRVGFVKFEADVTGRNADGSSDGEKVPDIVFLRGDSVAILVILECPRAHDDLAREIYQTEEYAVLTVQPRFAARSFAFAEIPAGMLDGSDNFVGAAAKELEQELGSDFKITFDELVPLGDAFFPSPGGCDERIKLFACVHKVSRAFVEELEGRHTGCLEENERITLKIVPLEDLANLPDAKSQLAYWRWRNDDL